MKKLFLPVLLIAGCSSCKPDIPFLFNNRSTQTIDSLVIDANGYRVRFYNVKPGQVAEHLIKQGFIKGTPVKMIPVFYSNGQMFEANHFYNDYDSIGAPIQDCHLKLDDCRKVKWEVVEGPAPE